MTKNLFNLTLTFYLSFLPLPKSNQVILESKWIFLFVFFSAKFKEFPSRCSSDMFTRMRQTTWKTYCHAGHGCRPHTGRKLLDHRINMQLLIKFHQMHLWALKPAKRKWHTGSRSHGGPAKEPADLVKQTKWKWQWWELQRWLNDSDRYNYPPSWG